MAFSKLDMLTMMARCEHNRAKSDFIQGVGSPEKESDLHQQIVDHCKSRNWICFHSAMHKRTTSTIGMPDFVILAGLGEVIMIECKKAKSKLTPEQLGLKAWAANLGHEIHTVRSFDEFLKIVN